MERLNDKEVVFNNWQLYSKAHDMYDREAITGIHKLKQFKNRNDVYNFRVYIKDNDVMIIAKNSESINIIFIGSDDLKDWRDNFDAKMITIVKGLKGHQGFKDASKQFLDIIIETLAPGDNVNFIGHSKGGAMALMAAILWANQAKNLPSYRITVVSYGAPRIADWNITQKLKDLNITYYRVIFSRDFVCDLPPIEMGFEHPWDNEVVILPETWWHRFRVRAIRVHLDYDRTINNKVYKQIVNQRTIRG